MECKNCKKYCVVIGSYKKQVKQLENIILKLEEEITVSELITTNKNESRGK